MANHKRAKTSEQVQTLQLAPQRTAAHTSAPLRTPTRNLNKQTQTFRYSLTQLDLKSFFYSTRPGLAADIRPVSAGSQSTTTSSFAQIDTPSLAYILAASFIRGMGWVVVLDASPAVRPTVPRTHFLLIMEIKSCQ
jgi:hypothetical protein